MYIEHRVYQVWGTGHILRTEEKNTHKALTGRSHTLVCARVAGTAGRGPSLVQLSFCAQLPQRLGCGITSILNNANAITIEAHSPGEGREIGI